MTIRGDRGTHNGLSQPRVALIAFAGRKSRKKKASSCVRVEMFSFFHRLRKLLEKKAYFLVSIEHHLDIAKVIFVVI